MPEKVLDLISTMDSYFSFGTCSSQMKQNRMKHKILADFLRFFAASKPMRNQIRASKKISVQKTYLFFLCKIAPN